MGFQAWPVPICIIKTFESKHPSIYSSDKDLNVIILRNPFNILASSLKYKENGGKSSDVRSDEYLLSLWIIYANEYLGITNIIKNKILILYDFFILDKNYRNKISNLLNFSSDIDILITLEMGGGSSFNNIDKNYLHRYKEYDDHPMMIKFKEELTETWLQLINFTNDIYNTDIQLT